MTKVAEVFESMSYGPAPEDSSAAHRWLEAHGRSVGPFIGGEFVQLGSEHERFDSVNPATAEPLAKVAQCGEAEVAAAVAAARRAQPEWWRLGGHGRARYLYALARKVQKHSRLLAVLETLDNGKPIRESRDIDVPLVARHFYHHAGWAQLLDTELPGWRPLGVAGQIIPWNFPLLMLAWKIAPALATGNTVVLKPAEYTTLTAIAFAELCRDAGLPPGVVNIVTGDGRTGEAIVGHPDIDKIAFTGSTEVGRIIRRATAGSGKKLSLELGGKSPFVVFDDGDLDGAVEGVVDAIWFNQGQVCCAGSRLLVQEGVAERFYDKLKAKMETLRIGDPLDKAIDIGAIVAPVQLERIRELVEQGRQEGAELWQPSWSCPQEGYFYPPSLFTNVAPASTIAQVEIFGPVLAAMTFRTPAEAVVLANNTRYGLAASVWSENINLALSIAAQIKAGTVWINSTNLFDAASGFGGYRESGFGREGGREGLFEYLQPARKGAKGGSAGTSPEAPKVAPKVGATSGASGEPTGEAGGPAAAPAGLPPVDRTAKMYIGGKQARPDGGYSRSVRGVGGPHRDQVVGEVGEGNRKDVRNAVEAAGKAAPGWAKASGHLRAQILFYIAENLAARGDELTGRLAAVSGDPDGAGREVAAAVERLFTVAAWADKYPGRVQDTPQRNFTFAVHEPIGTVAIVCPDESPLLAFCAAAGTALAMGDAVVAVPSAVNPLAATDLYQVLETSDLPGGVLNIVTGDRKALGKVLAEHDGVDALWLLTGDGDEGVTGELARTVEEASAGNLKRSWVSPARDWYDPEQGSGEELLRQAVQVKNIWTPWGE